MRRKILAAATVTFMLTGCALYDAAMQRLGVLGMKFSLASVDVSGLVYPGNFLKIGSLSSYGVDVRCQVKATNPNPHGALFDGGTGHLRVLNTAASDPDVNGTIPGFSIGADRDTAITVVFPLRLNSPVFSKAVWKKIVSGADIPYKIDADLNFKFLSHTGNGTLDSLGTRTSHIDVTKSSVNVKQASSELVQKFLSLLDVVL